MVSKRVKEKDEQERERLEPKEFLASIPIFFLCYFNDNVALFYWLRFEGMYSFSMSLFPIIFKIQEPETFPALRSLGFHSLGYLSVLRRMR